MSLVDIPSPAAEDQIMDPATKDFVESKLESSEARMSSSAAEFKTFVTAILARLEERDAARQRADSAQREDIQKQLDEFRKESRATRKVIIATGMTILFGTAGINAAIIQSFHNAFDIGQRYSVLQNELSIQSRQLTQMDGRLEAIEMAISEKKR